MIFSAVLTTLLTCLQSKAVPRPPHTKMQLVRMLSMVRQDGGGGIWALFSRRRSAVVVVTS